MKACQGTRIMESSCYRLHTPAGVSTSNYGVVGRSLLSDPVRHELTAVRKVRENSFE
ncbi:hypothetical protein T4E_5534 [Trichinella pseudospiralis]|uniref:Uncharacterized protein n=1 Tax=Trichinella pseudospiralis TaxID=6337 RepID=A0A0V0W676_TRIPS|nr:hypothetical protein T4E_5534 [Trichinella pseudospiralis]